MGFHAVAPGKCGAGVDVVGGVEGPLRSPVEGVLRPLDGAARGAYVTVADLVAGQVIKAGLVVTLVGPARTGRALAAGETATILCSVRSTFPMTP